MQQPFPNGRSYPFGCDSYVTGVAVDKNLEALSQVL
jgi:hypothetical protein